MSLEKIKDKNIIIGFDGFVDTIMHAVDKRTVDGYQRIPTITDFGQRILSAAHKSANIEWVPIRKNIGGNSVLMANALSYLGAQVRYMGTIGDFQSNIFKDFAQRTQAISLGDFNETRALEFQDGKLLFGEMAPLQSFNIQSIQTAIAAKDLTQMLSAADALAITNWTMTPHLDEVTLFFLEQLRGLPPKERWLFFDLADPEKRPRQDLTQFLSIIQQGQLVAKTWLGLNLREAMQIAQAIGYSHEIDESPQNMSKAAQAIQNFLQIDGVFIHGIYYFAGATFDDVVSVANHFNPTPKILTGAGDHFNAGFLASILCGLSLSDALKYAGKTCSFYIKHALSPSIQDIIHKDPH